jgi:putative ABC transport system permease protein
MRLLLRKAMRDIREARALFGAAAALAALAAMLFVAFFSAAGDIRASTDETYARLSFEDFRVPLQPGPADLLDRVRALPGVAAVEGRLSARLHVLLPSGETPSLVGGRAIAVGPRHPAVDDLYVEAGQWLSRPRGQVLLDSRFARAHRISVGDRLHVVGADSLTVVGLVSSPEYIWPVDDPSDLRPSATRNVVVFVSPLDAEALYGGPGINELLVRTTPRCDVDRVIDETVHAVGGRAAGAAIPRSAWPSHALLVRDERAIVALGSLFAAIFMGMAAIMTFTALAWLVSRQRRQIGILLGCGVRPLDIALHYAAATAVSSAAGALLGAILGGGLGAAITQFYAGTIGLPFMVARLHPGWMAASVLAVAALSLAGSLIPLRRLLHERPAALLGAALDPLGRTARLEPLRRFGLGVTLPARRLLRQPARSAVMALGAVGAVALLCMSLALRDAERGTLAFFFSAEHRYDLVVGIRDPLPRGELPPLDGWRGVREVEGVLRRRCRVESVAPRPAASRDIQVWGVPPGARLIGSYDRGRHPLPDDDAIHLSRPDASALGVREGDRVRLQIVTGDPHAPWITCRVGRLLFDPVPSPPRLPLRTLQRLAARTEGWAPDAVNTLLLAVHPADRAEVRARLERMGEIAFATDVHEIRGDVDLLLRGIDACFVLMNVLAGLLTFVLLAGGTITSVAERARETATMSALGVADRTQTTMLGVEVGFLWAIGVALGAPLGYGLAQWLLGGYDSELLQLSVHFEPGSALIAIAGSAVVTLAAALIATRSRGAFPAARLGQEDG